MTDPERHDADRANPASTDGSRTSLTRRQLVLRGSLVGAAAFAGGSYALERALREPPPFDRALFPRPGDAAVAVMHATSYDHGLEELVIDGLRLVGADIRGKSIVLKPNLVEFRHDAPVNTDPRLVAATAVVMRRLGARSVVVAEGPGHRRDTELVVRESGLFERLEEVGVPFVDLNVAPVVRRKLETSYTDLRELWLPRVIVDADLVVSMPKLKTHHWVGVTLSLKNCFGCVPGRAYGWPKNVLHWQDISSSILDVAVAVRPGLAIVDGIVGMEGDGPINGAAKPAGIVVFSRDPVAADVTAARLMGVDPEKVRYLELAGRILGQADPDRIAQRAEDPDRLVSPFLLAPGFEGLRD